MAPQTAQKAPPKTKGFNDYLNAAKALKPLAAAEAAEAEQLTHMTDKMVAAFKESGLYWLMTPAAAGGAELPWVEALEIVEQVGQGDGAAGWCLMVGNCEIGAGGAYLPDEGMKEVFAKGRDLLVAGQGIPRGIARKVDGGYQIHGDWSYASGIHHADYIHTGCILMDGDKPVMNDTGNPTILICHVAREDIELKHNWNTIGLRGTGSYDYSIPEMFVPEYLCHPFELKEPARGGNQFSIGLVGYTTWGHTAFALGLGRLALNELAEVARTKANVFGLVGEGPSFQERFARAEAQFRSVRAFCYSAWTDLSETLLRDEPASVEQIALVRLGMRYLHEVVSDVCVFAHKSGGGVSLRESVLQRCFRDIHAATQHILLSDQILQDCGKALLNMAGDNPKWTILGLK